MKNKIKRGTKLFTKDGRKTGNAIVLGTHEDKIICESDFGNIFVISDLSNYHVCDTDLTGSSDESLEMRLKRWYEDRSINIDNCGENIIVLNQITCKHCNDTIQSNHRHDFKDCKCGKVSVDGGHDYLRRVGEPDDRIEQSVVIKRYDGDFK